MSKTNTHIRVSVFAVLVATALIVGCGGGEKSASVSTPGGTGAPAEARASGSAAAEPATVVDLFPAAPARELVLNNCGTCHNVACTVIGQRSAARWDALNDGHKDKVKGVDLDAIFGYLKVNFDDSKPEPKVPSKFLEGGCTPF